MKYALRSIWIRYNITMSHAAKFLSDSLGATASAHWNRAQKSTVASLNETRVNLEIR